MENDEAIAARLQKEYDLEESRFKDQQDKDLEFARNLASSYHSISSDSEEEEIVKDATQVDAVNQQLYIESSPDRPNVGSEVALSGSKRKICKYGASCYRKNPDHVNEFYHPSDGCPSPFNDNSDSTAKKLKKETPGHEDRLRLHLRKSFSERLTLSDPCRVFLNKCYSVKETHKDWLTLVFPDLLNSHSGTLIESAQLNFMVDLNFIMNFYKTAGLEKEPILFMYGQLDGNPKDYPNVTCKHVNMPYQYGVHHSKMMLLQYKEGCRVVIHTANLIEDDWTEKTQGFWISDLFPPLGNSRSSLLEGESTTRFKQDLVDYLLSYKNTDLSRWVQILKSHDLSSCRAFFIGSVPGYHVGDSRVKYGHMKCRSIIRKHSSWATGPKQPVIVQCSSIGSLGKDAQAWLSNELAVSLSGGNESTKCTVNVIYPSVEDVRNSSQGYGGGSCLPYNSKTHSKQTWLLQHLHCWRSEKRKRTRAIPHIKTYCRLSADMKSIQYFLLTSSNLSKAAWGQLQKQGSQLFIRAYEAGVLLMPKVVANEDSFQLESFEDKSQHLTLPYDVPLVPYKKDDIPWFMDTHKSLPDRFNNTYP